jgi:hypothetical protein
MPPKRNITMTITEKVNNYPTKHEIGFTQSEINELLKEYPIDMDRFNEAMMGHTCVVIDNEIIMYHCDVEMAIKYSVRRYK